MFSQGVHGEVKQGPSYWGLINPEWSLCYKGRRQSPIDIDPGRLLYDPNLRALHIDKHRVGGNITNTGHSVILKIDNVPLAADEEDSGSDGVDKQNYDPSQSSPDFESDGMARNMQQHRSALAAGVNREEDPFRGALPVHKPVNITGGPLTYSYQVEEIHLHYGTRESIGSEHTINGRAFPAEGLLPNTDSYITYEGSITMPACFETVTWIVMNKPIYITRRQLIGLRQLMQGGAQAPKAPLGNNFRPPHPTHYRPVRTNINFKESKERQSGRHLDELLKNTMWKVFN
ncbi:unnamed protein product [Notodromas monacha]|uniref:Alpha-carbonic anhydrase domain-containing protein n=1 Tax=Notodromas monacha TaxID=399045 RepID=A0A7R9GF99_9CRUS|nr:unnamed protein product [Notodromas monacha]CAG0920577.1 unnamed protein product [Notodromas monacha]